MWLTAHHTHKVRVGAKIHMLPSPVTLMNSSMSRSFFLHVYPQIPAEATGKTHRGDVGITLYKCSGLSDEPDFSDFLERQTEWKQHSPKLTKSWSKDTQTNGQLPRTCPLPPSWSRLRLSPYSRRLRIASTEKSTGVVSSVDYMVGQSWLHLTSEFICFKDILMNFKLTQKFVFLMFIFPKMSDLDCTDLYPSKVWHSKSVFTFLYWEGRYMCTSQQSEIQTYTRASMISSPGKFGWLSRCEHMWHRSRYFCTLPFTS